MPSKLKKAISAMKDHTSISLAKVGGADSSNLEVSILKATTHDEVPVDERHVTEVLRIVSSNRSYAGSCARAIGRRIGRTRSWIVAAKSLMIVLRVFQDGDPHFPKEVLHAMKRGYKILNLNSFRDDSSISCPWDFTAFVRTFALYLDERLDYFLTGKLQRRTSYNQSGSTKSYSRKREPIVRDMKPSVLLDRILHWQKLLDRAIATQPTGAARTNNLVQTCLYTVVQETFELYRDISDGLALLLDSFFHLQYNNCVSAFQTCVKASKQFQELCTFYDLCKSIGVGRTSEYPSVQRVSEELIETLQEFLKDQSSFPGTIKDHHGAHLPPLSPNSDSASVKQSEFGGSVCTSLEDLIGGGNDGFSPDRYSDPGTENTPQLEEYCSCSANDTASVKSDPADHRGITSVMDLLSLDDGPSGEVELHQEKKSTELTHYYNEAVTGQGWELVLFETPANQPSTEITNTAYNNVKPHNDVGSNSNGFEVDFFSDVNAPTTSSLPSLPPLPHAHSYNPFLQDTDGGFPSDLGMNFAEFGNTSANATPTNANTVFAPTFSAEFSSNFQDEFFEDHSRTSNFSTNTNISSYTTTHGGFVEHNRSISSSFLDNFSQTNPNNPSTTTHHGRFASTDLSSLGFTGGININANNNNYNNNNNNNVSSCFSSPAIHHNRYGSNLSSTSVFSDTFDSFGGFNNGGISADETANTMNAIVPFVQAGNDDFFSGGPKLQSTPTFRATSVDMDQHHQQGNVWNENDPFESFPASLNANDQQQLWLQNQNKIIAKQYI